MHNWISVAFMRVLSDLGMRLGFDPILIRNLRYNGSIPKPTDHCPLLFFSCLQKIKYWTPLRFWACVSMVCACVFTDNKELILSLPLSKPLRIHFLEMVNGIIQWSSAVVARNVGGQTCPRRTIILLNSTVRWGLIGAWNVSSSKMSHESLPQLNLLLN